MRKALTRMGSAFLVMLFAAALTVLLQVWKRNVLLSILAGTAAYMLLFQMVF